MERERGKRAGDGSSGTRHGLGAKEARTRKTLRPEGPCEHQTSNRSLSGGAMSARTGGSAASHATLNAD